MNSSALPFRWPARPLSVLAPFIVLAFLLIAGVVWAQVAGDRGIPPVASSTDIEVGGIRVNVEGDSPQDAREKGWREAQILAWKKAGGPDLPVEQIESMVAAVVVEKEQIGPRRYIADLGVIFDHARAGGLLGGEGEIRRSPPLLTLPELHAGGTQTMFEERNPWQRAWAEFQAGRSAIDYVRPIGSGGESLLLTAGQTDRRSRLWWNEILDQFGAADVIMPVAHLRWEWPGGPVTGEFTARYGPDRRYLDSFTLQAANQRQLGPMLEQAVQRLDAIYARAFQEGRLEPDPTLATIEQVKLDPEIQALVEQGRRAEEAPVRAAPRPAPTPEPAPTEPQTTSFTIQFATPDPASIEAALASIRGAPGVQGVATTNVAVGGTSTMRVTFGGDLSGLIAALRSRGWSVGQTGDGLYATR